MTLQFKSLTAMLAATTMLAGPVLAAGTHPETGEALSDNQTFTYRILDEHSSVDPGVAEDVSGAEVIRDLFEGLMNQDENGNLVPGVATGFTTNDEKNVYTFTLRPEAMWSNGTPVTAGDFVYAWRRAASPELASPYSWYLELMSIENAAAVIAGEMPTDALGVTAIDDHTLEVRLSASLPYFPLMTTHTTTFPVPQAVVEEFGAEWTRPDNIVSNGAYVLTEHVPQERSVRERNPMYWNNDATIIEKVVTLVINDDDTALTRWKAGELDRTEIPTGQYPSLSQEYPGEALSFPRLCNYYYTFNLSESGPEAFKDVRVRQALSYAVDRSIITEQVLQGGQIDAFTFTPGATANFTVPEVAFGVMSQDERNAAAVALLAEAGYGEGLEHGPLTFELVFNTSEAHAQIATVVAQMWKQTLGIDVVQANMEWQIFLEERGNQNFEMARGAWCGDYNEASTFLDLLNSASGYNDGQYNNPEVDALLAEAKTMADPSANYTRIEEILADEMPVIPVYHYAGNMMLNAGIQNWPINNVEQNWYSRNLYRVDN